VTEGPRVGGCQQALIEAGGQRSLDLGVGAPCGDPRAPGTRAPWSPYPYCGRKVNAGGAIDEPSWFRGSPPPS